MIYYGSHTLNDAPMNYTVIGKEFSAIIFDIEKFRPYLIGFYVIVFTDQAILKHLLSKEDAKPTLMRWMLLL